MSQRVLLIEDIESLQLIYSTVLKREGFSVDVAATAAEGAAAFAGRPPGIVLLDLLLPDGDGLELLAQMTGALAPGGGPGGGLRVIVITAHGSVNRAVRAMRAGAFDFLVKPFDDGRLVAAVKNARADLQAAQVSPRAQRVGSLGFEGLMGSSPPMRDLYDKITQISRSVAPVMLSGAVGTGKRLAAEAIHNLSNRSGGAFVALDCAAEGAAPLEHRLFGTGGPRANDSPHGALDQADGGTLYLSDVTALDGANQARLLRFLQSSLPPGDLSPEPDRKRDVRLICSAQDDAAAAAALREDLFFRLNVVPLLLPPLAARGDDVIEIAQWALTQTAREERKDFTGLSRDVKRVFARHPWPGNVRQLLNLVRTAVVLNTGPEITLAMLPGDFLRSLNAPEEPAVALPKPQHLPAGQDQGNVEAALTLLARSGQPLAEIERALIEAVITQHNGSVPGAARQLGVSPSTLYRKRDAWAKG